MMEPLDVVHTKVTYLDGGAPTVTLRRCRIIVTRKGEQQEHVFERDNLLIGASEDNDLCIDDETVSRQHCRIRLEGDEYVIQDLGSTNGTFVNGVRIKEAYLAQDCRVFLGKSEMRFQPVDERLRVVPSNSDRMGEMIGRHAKMREIYAILEKIAPTDATIVVEGETGTGKEVVARTVHQESKRREGPFMVFDCGAVPANLIESELFGHEKGAFTGAVSTRQGVFEMAHGGTVFLDELGELALDLQPKLLRVLEQREVKRVGGQKPIKVDVRVVAATNRDLEDEVRGGRFREDLFYRLSVVRLKLPPLRDRTEDIALLIQHFLKSGNFNRDRGGEQKVRSISPSSMARLLEYGWPGNVRELHNVVERAVSFAESTVIESEDLPHHISHNEQPIAVIPEDTQVDALKSQSPSINLGGTFKNAKEQWVTEFEKDYITHLLQRNNNNISHAAREADIDRKYFRKLMKKYGIGSYEAEEA